MLEKRRSIRRRTLLKGRIEIPRLNNWSVDCTIRDVSEAGASLALPATPTIPAVFTLALSDRGIRAARLIWYRDGRAGVALTIQQESATPAAPAPPPIATWDGSCRRSPPRVPGAASDILARRIAAIAARPAQGERRRAT